jgi:Ser/Thr protein kinase RdoA (MazF antagonist)
MSRCDVQVIGGVKMEKSLKRLLIEQWKLPDSLELEKYHHKYDEKHERVWRVQIPDLGRFFLKQSTDKDSLDKQHRIVEVLAGEGVPVAVPVRTSTGEDLLQYGEHFYSLYPELMGAVARGGHFSAGASSKARIFGEGIGLLHCGLKQCAGLIDCKESNLVQNVQEWVIPALLNYEGTHKIDKGMVEKIREAYQSEFIPMYDALPKQIIHRDIHPENFLTDDERVTGFIDFELSEINVRLFDPCYCSTALLISAIDNEQWMSEWFNLYHQIMTGYDRYADLSETEKKAAWFVLLSIELVFMAFWCGYGDEKQLEDNEKALRWIWNNREQLNI